MHVVESCGAELTEERIAAAKAELVETDGEPLDSPWHRAAIDFLIEIIKFLYRGRTDYYVGGNMFIYYGRSQSRTHEYKGPDFFFVKGVDGTRERKFWWVFEEDNRYPDLIIELLSPTTAINDLTTKKDIYERVFHSSEYFCYDPTTRQLLGWRLGAAYEPLTPNERGWMWSEELQLWLGTWEGAFQGDRATWLRFYDRDGKLVPIGVEAERQRAEAERQRAEALEAEVVRLKALLGERGIAPPAP
jgi:Uma2 family endonuclease